MHTERDDPMELTLLGTGPSATLPHVDCLTAQPDAKPCRTCLSTLTPEGRKNKRRNTSAALRVRGRDGQLKTIVIDVGKSFLPAATEWFPKYGLRHIDAVLITHAHADAMNGLDDLRGEQRACVMSFVCERYPGRRWRGYQHKARVVRISDALHVAPGWTLHSAIQPHVDIYLSEDTFNEVKVTFPYLVKKEFATGGGDVPEFRWHPYVTDREPFELGDTGITVKPFAVPHGLCGVRPPVQRLPSIPDHIAVAAPFSTSSPYASGCPGTPTTTGATTPTENKQDFMCLGFTIQDTVTYISDCSRIPNDVLVDLQSSPTPVLVLDCLRLQPYVSHLSLEQAVGYARQLKARRTYLLGFTHDVSHEEYETMLRAVGGRRVPPKELTESVRAGLDTLDLTGERVWIRPAFDGLQVFVSEKGQVRDNEYDGSPGDG
ncbi:beta-lactamase-like protein [Ganoderma leucocontextum]|nr:beta-lactamase-like protein [Ganoderma leucocontextum]